MDSGLCHEKLKFSEFQCPIKSFMCQEQCLQPMKKRAVSPGLNAGESGLAQTGRGQESIALILARTSNGIPA
ncbi:hypothetical protein RRG08_052517 [Elysia crispata]|uniref:Uncharacterized protein n=1 Tax=Elysia crispata TaxID=231223 RepID=A0AAE0ZGT6_9GAST|nr:hypothetical protein RRG08_052517 [Elysia crispata]